MHLVKLVGQFRHRDIRLVLHLGDQERHIGRKLAAPRRAALP